MKLDTYITEVLNACETAGIQGEITFEVALSSNVYVVPDSNNKVTFSVDLSKTQKKTLS